ncbi:MAG: hypothetical protein K2K58_11850 [Muribaculaceae bacterium]|nr:hypothetical protein [Muribaculaceae bacterium]
MKPVPLLLTIAAAVIIFLFLYFGYMSFPPVSPPPKPEIALAATEDEEELFIEPEIVELGEQNTELKDAPAEALKGEPVQAPVEQTEVIEPGPKEKPAPPTPKVVTQKKESAVKATEPSKTDKERQEASSTVASKFSSRNGSPTGSDKGSAGAGGSGIGIAGSAHGRTFQGCPKPDVALRHKTVVKVSVLIDADGKVTEATASGSADASIRRKCEAAAKQARWSPKKGATPTRGTLTFTITPV